VNRHSDPTDYAVGALVLDLAARMAEAVDAGDWALAERWVRVIYRIVGKGRFTDTNNDLRRRREADR
jgi:hypothetical protein